MSGAGVGESDLWDADSGQENLADEEFPPDASLPATRAAPPRGAAAEAGPDELAAMVARVMRQDDEALSALYLALSSQVYSVALQITRNVSAAEEVMQDVFWQVWRQAPRYDAARGSVRGWVLTMARSRALDAYRSNRRDQCVQYEADFEQPEEAGPGQEPEPSELVMAGQMSNKLERALASLDPIRRQLISLSFYRGLTQQEIASHTGMPLGTVKSHIRRGLEAMRDAMDGEYRSAGA